MNNRNYVSYRGVYIDMEALKNENENVPAMGNMNVNARGDILGKDGTIAKTVDEIAREHHRVRTAIKYTGLKGPEPQVAPEPKSKKQIPSATGQPIEKNPNEVEQDNRDIIINEGKE